MREILEWNYHINVDDMMVEILRCLPSKSLMRFKCVCKSWHALIMSRYFCSLWRKNPGIILITDRNQRYFPLSAGKPHREIPLDHYVLQSCNGFILHMRYDAEVGTCNYWVYNPASSEVVLLPPPRLDACKIHPRSCGCIIQDPVMAFDSHSRGRVVALARHLSRSNKHLYTYQVCVTENKGPWRSSSVKPRRMFSGVHWRNFVVWVKQSKTLFYDVGAEAWRVRNSPRFWGSYPCHLGESGGHLHSIQVHGSRLFIMEMKHDLSGWLVKHKVELSDIKESLFWSIGWDKDTHDKINISLIVMEEKEDSKLVLRCNNDVVLYRIQDHKSWKLCEPEFLMPFPRPYFHKFVHVETIYRFHDQF